MPPSLVATPYGWFSSPPSAPVLTPALQVSPFAATQISGPVPVLPGPALTTSSPQALRKLPAGPNFWIRLLRKSVM